MLGETARLLAAHLNLFTLISLTVWLPGHVARNYLEFFARETSPVPGLRLVLVIQLVFDPLIVAATLSALGRIKQALPIGYRVVMAEGLGAWGRLFVVRLIINTALALPAVGALLIGPAGRAALGAGALLSGLAVVIVVLLVRYAVVDAVVVLGGANALNAWPRAAALTAGQRRQILGTAVTLFVGILAFAMLAAQAFRVAPALNHFVVRVMVDCALAVSQSLFTIAFFLFYWRARAAGAPPPA